MVGLSTALSSALSGLVATSGQSAVVSRNVARANDEDYTRKILNLTTDFSGEARAGNIVRAAEHRLSETANLSNSALAGQLVFNQALEGLSSTIGDPEVDGSLGWSINQLQSALVEFEARPDSMIYASQSFAAASELARHLNDSSSVISNIRSQADSDIAASVKNVNQLLSEIQDLNTQITGPVAESSTRAELMDRRDAAVRKLSEEFGIRTAEKPNNGIAIYTQGGVTLFDVSARSVTFQPTNLSSATGSGNNVFVDGVQVTGVGAPMPLKEGKITANIQVRDKIAVAYQRQLDEVARVLVISFSEQDQSVAPSRPDATGLFRYENSPIVPGLSTIHSGLAAEIRIDDAFDPNRGGNPLLIRDGGKNGPSYVYNSSNLTGYQLRLSALTVGLNGPQSFDLTAGLGSNINLKSFANSSASSIEQLRSDTARTLDQAQAMHQRSTDAVSRKSGVNIDEEMATLLSLEKSYQASAKVMTSIDQMLSTLMQIVR